VLIIEAQAEGPPQRTKMVQGEYSMTTYDLVEEITTENAIGLAEALKVIPEIETINYTINFKDSSYGWFEHNEDGDEDGGGLWFEDGSIVDYDGVFELSAEIIEALENAGFNMDYVKDED
tara:strand:- start:469 stop:828 length:360 start_codon:yes stop_codon:yes gene_type:complete